MAEGILWRNAYVIEDLQVHGDERGILYEVLRFSSQNITQGGQIYAYTVAPGARRGDHFHQHKSEWFTCVSGQLRLLMKTKDGYRVDELLDSDSPRLVFAGPGTSHAVVNETDREAVIIAYASKEFDPAAPDTIIEPAD